MFYRALKRDRAAHALSHSSAQKFNLPINQNFTKTLIKINKPKCRIKQKKSDFLVHPIKILQTNGMHILKEEGIISLSGLEQSIRYQYL